MSTEVPSKGSSPAASTSLVTPAPGKAADTCVPVSRVAFPFNSTAPSNGRKPLTSPPASLPQHRHRRFIPVPSPLGRKDDTTATAPPRRSPVSRIAAYRAYHRHHGYSRQALLHSKWFWSTREGEWQQQQEDSAKTVSTGQEVSAGLRTSVPTKVSQCLRGTRPAAFEGDDEERSTLTAFPRRGDITALRDPYCVEADRCFAHVPIWTLAKVLWIHDMHALSQPKVDVETPTSSTPSEADEDNFDEASSVASFDTATESVDFSDDSESTLVDSENEWESGYFKGWESPHRQAGSALSSMSSSASSSTVDVSPLAWAKDVYLKPPPRSSSSSHPPNWYRRWEVLLELSKSEKRPEKSPPIVVKPLPVKKAAPPPPKRYSFTRGFLTGLKKTPRSPTTVNYVVQESFINASHPAAG